LTWTTPPGNAVAKKPDLPGAASDSPTSQAEADQSHTKQSKRSWLRNRSGYVGIGNHYNNLTEISISRLAIAVVGTDEKRATVAGLDDKRIFIG
jgi:hypothetical protein